MSVIACARSVRLLMLDREHVDRPGDFGIWISWHCYGASGYERPARRNAGAMAI